MRIEYRAPMNQIELDDTIECCIRAFGGSEGIRHLFTNIVKQDPWFHLNNTRACFLNGKAVSVVQIFDRPMRIGNAVVRMGGVGSVGTDPAYRRTGYSSEVLRDSARYMRSAGFDLSILFTGIQSHYARAGWVMYPSYSMRLTPPETLPEKPNDVTIVQCDMERDLPVLRNIYDQFNASRSGTVARTEEYWRRQPQWRGYDPALFWIARQGGSATAYLKAGQWEIRELGYLAGMENAAKALLSHLFALARARDVKEIHAPCPSTCRTLFETLGCAIQRRESNHTMIFIANFQSLLTKVAPLLETRLRQSDFAGWTGAIRIRYEADEQTLAIQRGEIRVLPRSNSPEIVLNVSQTQLLKLLFGNMSAEQVAFSNNLTLDADNIRLLETLFPPGELFMWGTDGF
jgi:hypothetical protein